VDIKLIVARLKFNVVENDQARTDAHCQAKDVDEREQLPFKKIPDSEDEEVFEHRLSFYR
jgi:hypothetical protein